MRLLLTLMILLFALNASAQDEVTASPTEQAAPEKSPDQKGRAYNINDLVYDCIKCSSDEKSDECIYCNGLITGTASTLAVFEMGKSFCPPVNMDTKLARNMFRRWAHGHKSNEDPAVAGIIASLQESFPCDKKSLGAREAAVKAVSPKQPEKKK
ncbi:MAG: hypothetical protein EB060_02280 [Proteobacteria bacterium]|nr:hypothetical protein [Pseudomonadota bacterium]